MPSVVSMPLQYVLLLYRNLTSCFCLLRLLLKSRRRPVSMIWTRRSTLYRQILLLVNSTFSFVNEFISVPRMLCSSLSTMWFHQLALRWALCTRWALHCNLPVPGEHSIAIYILLHFKSNNKPFITGEISKATRNPYKSDLKIATVNSKKTPANVLR